MGGEMGFLTDCVSTGENRRSYHGSVSPPIYESSLFTAPSIAEFERAVTGDVDDAFVYTRGSNPTIRVLEEKLALLEKTETAKFFASGMAAIAAVTMEAAAGGGHIIASRSLYNHAYKLMAEFLPSYGIDTSFVDATNLSSIEAAIRTTTKLLYLESPANPTMHLTDISACVLLAHRHGLLTAIDNSLATPFNQQPATMGIDYVIHSATKYLGGHSDVVAGAVAGSHARIKPLMTRQHADLGGILGPFEGWLILRGMRTLGIRMQTHNANALQLARHLEKLDGIRRVNYPLLESHPQIELARSQLRGGSGMISLVIEGTEESARRFVDHLRLFGIGVSWGGFESLALPLWKGSAMPESQRREIGLMESLVRLSIGLEDVEDLREDIEESLRLALKGNA